MKKILSVSSPATLFERQRFGALEAEEVRTFSDRPDSLGLPASLPAQVADILLAAGRITDPRRLDGARECLWIAERDWVYRIPLPNPQRGAGARVFLHCLGLDTLADLYLNGQPVGVSRNFYLPLRIDITECLGDENTLLVHFHSPHRWIRDQPLDPAWRTTVHPNRLLRKPHEDFNSFNGAYPHFTPVGVYDKIQLEVTDGNEIQDLFVRTRLAPDRSTATVSLAVELSERAPAGAFLDIRVEDRAGIRRAEARLPVLQGSRSASASLEVPNPNLWWPRGYGDQPLYDVIAELGVADQVLDRGEKRIGFREIALRSDFALRVNGVPVKLWGANLAPLEQFTHVWPADRVERLLTLAENADCVTLRLWGPGAPYGDNLYEECDRRGILIWSELHHTWGMYPEDPEYLDQCRQEAEAHVRRLHHHPSIFMWCGGNEVHMGADMTHPGKPVVGKRIFDQVYPEVFARLDPDRYFHPDSPVGGAFPNDPDHGDSHGYTHFWFVRGCQHPVILTENARWSPPSIRTLRRYIPDPVQFWPPGFRSRVTHRRAPPSGPGSPSAGLGNDGARDRRDIHDGGLIPPAWQLLGKDGGITNGRVGPIGDFYETGDTPEGLVHRIGAAHSLFVRREIERLRRGRPAHEAHLPRRTQGHYWWRLNGTWPLIDSELIDYLLEPKMAYYAAARAQRPLLLSFEFGDRIHLWMTNDSTEDLDGTVHLDLMRMDAPSPLRSLRSRFTARAGCSDIVMPLDALGMFRRDLVLLARFVDDAGKERARTCDFAYEERNIVFPDPALSLEQTAPDAFLIRTDVFARCVEITATTREGDAFGWDFSDNYLDLVPGEARAVRILGPHREGTLFARGFFASSAATLLLGPQPPS